MRVHKLLAQTQDRFGIVGKELAQLAGLTPQYISDVRTGKRWMSEASFEKILDAMDQLAPGSKGYFCRLLAEDSPDAAKTSFSINWEELVAGAEEEEIHAIIRALGKRYTYNPPERIKQYLQRA